MKQVWNDELVTPRQSGRRQKDQSGSVLQWTAAAYSWALSMQDSQPRQNYRSMPADSWMQSSPGELYKQLINLNRQNQWHKKIEDKRPTQNSVCDVI